MGGMNALAQIADRIGPLIGKLGSPHDGEVLSAARALGRQLDNLDLNFNDLAIALLAEPITQIVYRDPEADLSSDWCAVADWCANRPECLSDKELDFVTNMRRTLRRAGAEPTSKQATWLQDIWDRIREEMAA